MRLLLQHKGEIRERIKQEMAIEVDNKITGSAIPQNQTRFLRLAEVKKLTSLSKSAIYVKIANREFPRSVHLSRQTVAWVESEVIEWMNLRLSSRDKGESV